MIHHDSYVTHAKLPIFQCLLIPLEDILRGHVLDGAQFGKLISMRAQLVTMNQDQRIEAKVIKRKYFILFRVQ